MVSVFVEYVFSFQVEQPYVNVLLLLTGGQMSMLRLIIIRHCSKLLLLIFVELLIIAMQVMKKG